MRCFPRCPLQSFLQKKKVIGIFETCVSVGGPKTRERERWLFESPSTICGAWFFDLVGGFNFVRQSVKIVLKY